MDFAGYEIFITNMSLPHLDATYTSVDVPDKSFTFKRDTNKSQVFEISGYIQKATWALTRAEAEGLNDALNTTPSGTLTDGYGTTYACLVDDWEISPVAAKNMYTFTMSLRIPD